MLHWVIIALGSDRHLISNQKCGIEANTELTDEIGVSTLRHCLQKVCGSGSRYCTQIVNQVGFGHADTSVNNGDRLRIRIMLDLHLEILCFPEVRFILYTVEASLFK